VLRDDEMGSMLAEAMLMLESVRVELNLRAQSRPDSELPFHANFVPEPEERLIQPGDLVTSFQLPDGTLLILDGEEER